LETRVYIARLDQVFMYKATLMRDVSLLLEKLEGRVWSTAGDGEQKLVS
jgi:hypothetical protein